MTDLDKLIEAVEAGRDDSEKWRPAMGGNQYLAFKAMESFHGSIDAAEALHDALLPGWVAKQIGQACIDGSGGWSVWLVAGDYLESSAQAEAKASNPARAWLLAILKEYRAQVQP